MGMDVEGVEGGVWSGAYREVPWHGVGESKNTKGEVVGLKVQLPNDRVVRGEELLQLASLDWSVKLTPLSEVLQVPGAAKHALVQRVDNERVLGAVSARYGVIQNTILGAYTDAILDERSDARPVSAVSLWGGEVVFVVIEFPELARNIRSDGSGGEEMSRYMGVYLGHNGQHDLAAVYMNTLWVCQNTFTPWTAKRGLSVRHTRNGQAIAEAARETISQMTRQMQEFDIEINRLNAIKVGPVKFERALPKFIGPKPKGQGRVVTTWENARSCIISEWQEKTAHETAFDAVMAVQGYEQHSRSIRNNPRDVSTIARLIGNRWPLTGKAAAVFGKN